MSRSTDDNYCIDCGKPLSDPGVPAVCASAHGGQIVHRLDPPDESAYKAGKFVGGEIRVTDPNTGAQKGSKLERFDLIPAAPLRQLAEHYGRGSHKYEDRNWERGYAWSLSYAAMMRHALAFWGGEDIDPETGSPHIVAVAWHAFALLEFMSKHPEKDDRP